MGFFSWKTSDTGRSIPNTYSNRSTFTVYLLDNKGNKWREDEYEGYGVFNGKDAYQLLAEMNVPDQCTGDVDHDREIGITLAFGTDPVEFLIKLVENGSLVYDDVKPSAECPTQGYFYYDDKD